MGRDAKINVVDKLETPGPAGAVQFTRGPDGKISGWNHACPCGCGSWSYMGLDPELNTSAATWQITAGGLDDLEHLSLTPSIGIRGGHDGTVRTDGYHWHGFLVAGVFEECS